MISSYHANDTNAERSRNETVCGIATLFQHIGANLTTYRAFGRNSSQRVVSRTRAMMVCRRIFSRRCEGQTDNRQACNDALQRCHGEVRDAVQTNATNGARHTLRTHARGGFQGKA